MTQVSEAALQEQVRTVQADVVRSLVTAEAAVDKKMREVSVLLDKLQEEDDDMKIKVEEMEYTINKHHDELQQADADLLKQVSLVVREHILW
jgi:uncharacterized coiled-coil DUF342 family protein